VDKASVAHCAPPSTHETPTAARPRRTSCAGCGESATRLAPLHGAKTGAELRSLPLYGACCNPRLRPRNLAGIFEGL
jgi:hypothetical protein